MCKLGSLQVSQVDSPKISMAFIHLARSLSAIIDVK